MSGLDYSAEPRTLEKNPGVVDGSPQPRQATFIFRAGHSRSGRPANQTMRASSSRRSSRHGHTDPGRTASRIQACGLTLSMNDHGEKTAWQGVLLSVQPRIRLTRSFDQRSHTYLGYALKVRGTIGNEAREYLVGVGQGTHAKHHFQTGTAVFGEALPVPDPRLETAEFYKLSKLKVGPPNAVDETTPPPWRGVPPSLAVYRERGHRRLAVRTFQKNCWSCNRGCRMPVEMIIDQWNPSRRRYGLLGEFCTSRQIREAGTGGPWEWRSEGTRRKRS